MEMSIAGRYALKLKKLSQQRRAFKSFRKEFDRFAAVADTRFRLEWKEISPYLEDKTAFTNFDAHYIYHPAWAARIVRQINPDFHVDISSSLHFCTQLSAFIPVRFYDYRPAVLALDNLQSEKADLTNLFFESDSIECLSCMHTVEHIGLGRYGDPIDPQGDLKAIAELKRVVRPGGSLLFVTPVGKPRIVFNAHRIYSANAITGLFNGFKLAKFSLVDDNGSFFDDTGLEKVDQQQYGCGCFWFRKDI